MNQQEIRAGNITTCQTPATIRQAVYENRKKVWLATDIIDELRLMKLDFNTTMAGSIPGFVQAIGVDPFFVVFYSAEQVRLFVDQCKDGGCVVHIDSTGSIVREIKGQKRPYYYSVILADHSIPVCEFITTCHRGAWLMSLLEFFCSHSQLQNNGRRANPHIIVLDFSFALINCVMLAFNKCKLLMYLQAAWKFLSGQQKRFVMTIVKLCCAHFMKAAANRLVRLEKKKGIRKAVLVVIAALQRCRSLSDAANKYLAAFHLFTESKKTAETETAKNTLLNESNEKAFHEQYGDLIDEVSAEETELQDVSERQQNLRKQSPFSRYFASIVRRSENDGTQNDNPSQSIISVPNELYSPSALKVVTDLLPYFPMWSGVLHPDSDNPTQSNATVESHFRNLKHSTLNGRKCLRPGDVIRNELTFILAKVNERQLDKGRTTSKKRKHSQLDDLDNAEEVWRKRRKAGNYGNIDLAKKRLFKDNKPTM